MPIDTGLVGTATLDISDLDTAEHLHCGDVPTLATPRLIELCEQATINAVASVVSGGKCCVALSVQLDHLRPSAVGGRVTAEAVLERVDGKRLIFTVTAKDDRGLVAAGKMTRALVDFGRFMERAS